MNETTTEKKLTTTETNAIIAKFMGGILKPADKERPNNPYNKATWWGVGERKGAGNFDLQYNSNWNWLMPVITKIESLGFYVSIMKSNITCCKDGGIKPIFSEYNYKDKHETTYLAVIEFINWYNKQTEWFNNK